MEKSTNEIATILLVDDREENLLVIEELLQKEGRILFKATSGNEALKIAFQEKIDLVILDVQMPGMDGFEVARLLKSKKQTQDVPIIFASAEKKDHGFVMKGFDEGAIDYLYKPLDPAITRAKVAVLLKLQLQKKELTEKNNSLEKSALLINNSADIIGVIDAATLKFEEVNSAFAGILGYQPEAVYGTWLNDFLPETAQQTLKRLCEKPREVFSFEVQVYDIHKQLKWLQWNVVNKNGKWFFNARDTTVVKEVERIKTYLATIVEQSIDATYIHDSEARILFWNEGARQMYGYTEEEARTMKVWDIIPEDLQSHTRDAIEQLLRGENVALHESRRKTKSGKVVDVMVSSSLITDTGNGEKSIAITERDITGEKLTGEQIRKLNMHLQQNIIQLEAANHELESFSYSVSHDLRAPLRAVSGYAHILEENYSKMLDVEGKRIFETIQRNIKKMGQLIDDLLNFSKLGRKEVPKCHINIEQLVTRTIQDLSQAVPHNATIDVKPLPEACGDHALLTQVWINLISNAIKYTQKVAAPRIEIGSFQDEGETVFFIKDNGVGFDMRYVDKLFGVFQRLHSTKEFEGTGIGLAIIKRIISKHGGRVWAEGEVNKGATFYFSLPNEV